MSEIEQRVAALEKALAALLHWKAESEAAAATGLEHFRAIMTAAAVDEACRLAGLDPVDR